MKERLRCPPAGRAEGRGEEEHKASFFARWLPAGDAPGNVLGASSLPVRAAALPAPASARWWGGDATAPGPCAKSPRGVSGSAPAFRPPPRATNLLPPREQSPAPRGAGGHLGVQQGCGVSKQCQPRARVAVSVQGWQQCWHRAALKSQRSSVSGERCCGLGSAATWCCRAGKERGNHLTVRGNAAGSLGSLRTGVAQAL